MEQSSLGLVGRSESHQKVLDRLARVASTDVEILITGPSGVGKELYAQYAHEHSYRRDRRFVPLNCGGLSAELLENELFGHISGAFTGAKLQHDGLVSEAEGGTLFLDEVNSLPVACQIKLLRFLQDRKFRRLGEARLRHADVRIIAATNVDLRKAVAENGFRADLFFRLCVVPVDVEPLRSRPADIPVLLSFFVERTALKYKRPALRFSAEAMRALLDYAWPGNVRELQNCVACLTCLALDREVTPHDLPITAPPASPEPEVPSETFQDAKSRVVEEFERRYIRNALVQVNGNVSAAARNTGKDRRALFELMRKHAIDPAQFRGKDGVCPELD